MPYMPKSSRKPWLPKKETGAFTGYTKKNKKFYNSKPWKLIRQQALERDEYCCVICKRESGRISQAKIVDHIQTVNNRPELALVLSNLQSLCVRCNARKTRNDRRY